MYINKKIKKFFKHNFVFIKKAFVWKNIHNIQTDTHRPTDRHL